MIANQTDDQRHAIMMDNVDTVKQLIVQGANVNQIYENSGSITQLFAACKFMNIRMVQLLVEHGADMEITDKRGRTCLMPLLLVVHTGILKHLLSVGARVNRRKADDLRYRISDYMEVLHESDAITRWSKNEHSLVTLSELLPEQYPMKSSENSYFDRPSNKAINMTSSVHFFMEKTDVYKLCGAILSSSDSSKTLHVWSKALSMCEKVDIIPKQRVQLAPPCGCRSVVNTKNAENDSLLSKSGDAWSVVSLAAQESVSGGELLQCSIKPNQPPWMSDFLPCFTCPTSLPWHIFHTDVHPSVSKMMRYCGFGKAYLVKWEKLRSELQAMHESGQIVEHFRIEEHMTTINHSLSYDKPVRIQQMQSNVEGRSDMNGSRLSSFSTPINNGVFLKPTSMVDVILGIQPVCFVEAQPNGNYADPQLHYLQRHWLIRGCNTPPRTTSRCSLKVCTVCGHIVVQFGGGNHSQPPRFILPMPNVTTYSVCKQRRSALHGNGNQPIEAIEHLLTGRVYLKDCASESTSHSIVGGETNERANNGTSEMKICPRCGLVSDQHPLLQRLKQCSEEIFGNVDEFVTTEELAEINNNPRALQLQKILIMLRIMCRNDPSTLTYYIRNRTFSTNLPTFEKFWHYINASLKIFPKESYEYYYDTVSSFVNGASELLQGKSGVSIDACLVMDSLQLLVDFIVAKFPNASYRSVKREIESSGPRIMFLFFDYIVLILKYFIRELPSYIELPLFDELASNEFGYGVNNDNVLYLRPQFCEMLIRTTNASGNGEATSLQRVPFSPELLHRFFIQVRRLVSLDPRCDNGYSVIYYACRQVLTRSDEVPIYISVVALLLRLGADPNWVGIDGDTLVGFVLRYFRLESNKMQRLLAVLINGGAHFDAYKRLQNNGVQDRDWSTILQKYNICPVRNGKLTCLTAATIRSNGLLSRYPNCKLSLPADLLKFIYLH